jgi:hypothetical protein
MTAKKTDLAPVEELGFIKGQGLTTFVAGLKFLEWGTHIPN